MRRVLRFVFNACFVGFVPGVLIIAHAFDPKCPSIGHALLATALDFGAVIWFGVAVTALMLGGTLLIVGLPIYAFRLLAGRADPLDITDEECTVTRNASGIGALIGPVFVLVLASVPVLGTTTMWSIILDSVAWLLGLSCSS